MKAEKNNAPPLVVSAPSGRVESAAEGGSETILIAEDDAALRTLAEHTLRAAGYTVLAAKDGEEALRLFEKRADEIDMAVFDVVMPRMGGVEAMETILKRRPGLPHFFVSGYIGREAYARFAKEKHLPILDKPYPAQALLRKIREKLDRQ
ncbi:MAG: response regulator [Kiritimatiellales bacterium]|nr:response regulator [Kiritimatiellota bacterium]MBL7016579.1 response regulator [Kiritimatiellales bacterium]